MTAMIPKMTTPPTTTPTIRGILLSSDVEDVSGSVGRTLEFSDAKLAATFMLELVVLPIALWAVTEMEKVALP